MRPRINISALVQIMAWRRPGDKPLTEPMMVSLLTYIYVTRPHWYNGMSFVILSHFIQIKNGLPSFVTCSSTNAIYYICRRVQVSVQLQGWRWYMYGKTFLICIIAQVLKLLLYIIYIYNNQRSFVTSETKLMLCLMSRNRQNIHLNCHIVWKVCTGHCININALLEQF